MKKSKPKQFLDLMIKELDKNNHKGNWEEFTDIKDIMLEIDYHKSKLHIALKKNEIEEVKEYIADTANCLMFLANAIHILK